MVEASFGTTDQLNQSSSTHTAETSVEQTDQLNHSSSHVAEDSIESTYQLAQSSCHIAQASIEPTDQLMNNHYRLGIRFNFQGNENRIGGVFL